MPGKIQKTYKNIFMYYARRNAGFVVAFAAFWMHIVAIIVGI